ncbi:aldehyde dehydrogenase family protein [Enterocloster bolteae]|uniref:aldehyde dehydrogenase family protein n=1 Tax=Enterocloster bolteae TaxID=208479 RepID=UPI001D0766C6|nr:aldehyde dehydrogenase family protein [Enterocloster bolteae]MCB6798232.1 aldehyde dehydrogenase family protein [Enterocloster bolteae]MCB7231490.1 aldehyde dehydrogenase family protein [Enterocloster bolteae]MCG4943586.1 aldehyde dehydrogenase family protein [Enterocloster bolteae]MCG4949597.1 aldehyde dehydrogenase family protein [Enterocloster bolteae]
MNKPELQNRYQLFIGGQWRDASDGEFFTTKCPANGEKLAECAQATKEDVDDAVREAWKAFETWKKVPTSERAAILNKIADIIDANTEHLAMVESLDNGKPIRETMAIDIPLSAKHFRYFAGCIMAEEGSANILDEQFLSLILREPIGVVGQIVPWNFPFLMAAWKLAPVLAAGCCTVFKPSSDTSLSVLEFARLVQDVIPKGVFNVITGSGSKSGQYMLDHKGFRKLAFTGSTEVGRQVALAAADRLIPATLELGGKSANIFFPDCNWEQAIDGLQLGILFNQGQVCCAGSRVFVHEDIYDKFLEDAVKAFNNVKVGVSWDPETQMGSQINERQLEKILSYVEIGKQEGTRLICGGERITDGELAKGCFMRPTLLADVTNDMRVAQEEIFGPVACILKFRDEDEVIRMANDNAYGLGGAVWTRDLNRAIRVSRGIETGRMWVNTYNQIPEGSPFGGYKESGIGRETHKVILEHYTQMKNIMINLSEAPSGFYPAK